MRHLISFNKPVQGGTLKILQQALDREISDYTVVSYDELRLMGANELEGRAVLCFYTFDEELDLLQVKKYKGGLLIQTFSPENC